MHASLCFYILTYLITYLLNYPLTYLVLFVPRVPKAFTISVCLLTSAATCPESIHDFSSHSPLILRQVSFGHPLFQFQCGIHLNASLTISDVAFLGTWTIDFCRFSFIWSDMTAFFLVFLADLIWPECLENSTKALCLDIFEWRYTSPSKTQNHIGEL